MLPHSPGRNCDHAAAAHYLDMAQGDLDTAVELYISMSESGQGGSPASFPQQSAPSTRPSAASRQRPVVVPSDSDDDGYMEVDRDDPAPGDSAYAAELSRAIAQRDGDRQQAAHLRQQHSLFSRAPPRSVPLDSFANYSEPERANPLSKMFGMPVFCLNACPDIATFPQAKNAAAGLFKKLIVNVLDQSMTSLDQNRDLWPHDDVAALVVEHFCMFQLHKNSDAAAEYLQLYSLRQGIETHKLPIVDILDPLTGMLLQRVSGPVSVRELCGTLRRHASDDVSVGAPFSQSSFASPSMPSQSSQAYTASQSDGGSVWSGVGDGGDEDIARAIAASLGDPDASAPLRPRSPPRTVSSAQKVRDETDNAYKESLRRDRLADEERERAKLAEEQRLVMEKAHALAEAQRLAKEEQTRAMRKSALQSKFAQEPSSSDSVSLAFRYKHAGFLQTRVTMLLIHSCCRFSDGRRVKRKFDSGDVVRSLYDYVELEFGVASDLVLICTTMPRVCWGHFCFFAVQIMFWMQTEIQCSDVPLSQLKVRCAILFLMVCARLIIMPRLPVSCLP